MPTDDNDVLSRWIDNFRKSWEVPVRMLKGDVQTQGDLAIFAAFHPTDFFYGSMICSESVSPATALSMTSKHFAYPLQPEIWTAWPSAISDNPDWSTDEEHTLMLADDLTPPGTSSETDDVDVREVMSEDDAKAFFRLISINFQLGKYSDPPALDFDAAESNVFKMFLAWKDGRAIATSTAVRAAGLNGVTYVTTLPSHRRKGLGTMMIRTAASAFPDIPTALVATAEAKPLYKTLGYRSVLPFTVLRRHSKSTLP